MDMDNYHNYAKDCIHLHACRLMAKRYRDAGCKHVARHCDDECICYQRAVMHECCDLDDALSVARDGCRMASMGWHENDAVIMADFPTFIAWEILNGDLCADD